MDGSFTPQLEIGQLANQFHKPADGLGHLFLFPMEELEKHAERLIRILEMQGLTQEVIHEEGSWKRSMFSNEGGSMDIRILDEIWDIKRAISIGKTLGPNMFRVMRDGVLSQGIVLDNNIKLSSFVVNSIEEKSPFLRQNEIMQRFKIITGYLKSFHVMPSNPDKFKESLEYWANLDIQTIEKEGENNLDKTYQEVFYDFVEWVVNSLDMQGKLEEQKKELQSVINSLNGSGEEFDFDKFLQALEKEGVREIFEKGFVASEKHEDRYPGISHEDLFGKTIHKASQVVRGPTLNRVVGEVAGMEKELSLKSQLRGSTSM